VQYVQEVESHTVGHSVASTELEENVFSIKEEIESKTVDWVMRDEESCIGNWTF
jgi:hypothetical protein